MLMAAVIVAGTAASPAIGAAGIDDPARRSREIQRSQQDFLDRQKQEIQRRLEQAPSGRRIEPGDGPDLQGDGCIAVRFVAIDGMAVFDKARFSGAIRRVTAPPCAGLAEINGLVRAISNAYVSRGYVTSQAFLPSQDAADGVLQIRVVEGFVDDVVPLGDPLPRRALATAMPGLAGGPLNLRIIEQGIDQINRLSSARATADILPGRRNASSIVQVRHSRVGRPVRAIASIETTGQDATGDVVYTASIEADSLAGLNEFISGYYSRDANGGDAGGTEAYGGFLSLPYGAWTLSLNGGGFRYDSVIQGRSQAFASNGESWNLLARLSRMVFRDAKAKVDLSAALKIIDTANFIEDVRLLSSSYRLAVLSIEAGMQRRTAGGLLSAALGYRRGLDALGADRAPVPGGPMTEFDKLTLRSSFLRPFDLLTRQFRYTGLLRAEWGFKTLFPAERMSVGGPATVRGFFDDGISGERGLSTRHEIDARLASFGAARSIVPETSFSSFVGYDAGGILADDSDVFERGLLQAIASGLRLANRYLEVEVAAAIPLSSPDFIDCDGVALAATARIVF